MPFLFVKFIFSLLLSAQRAMAFCSFSGITKIAQFHWCCKKWILLIPTWNITLLCGTHLKASNPQALHKWKPQSPFHSSSSSAAFFSCIRAPHTHRDSPFCYPLLWRIYSEVCENETYSLYFTFVGVITTTYSFQDSLFKTKILNEKIISIWYFLSKEP